MVDFTSEAVSAAKEISRKNKPMSSPLAVAGLADTVRKAIDGMARAKASADALNAGASRLVGNIASVDAIKRELDSANEQLEQAVEAVGIPLEPTPTNSTSSNDAGEPTAGAQTAPPTPEATKQGEAIEAQSPEHGIKLSLNAVSGLTN